MPLPLCNYRHRYRNAIKIVIKFSYSSICAATLLTNVLVEPADRQVPKGPYSVQTRVPNDECLSLFFKSIVGDGTNILSSRSINIIFHRVSIIEILFYFLIILFITRWIKKKSEKSILICVLMWFDGTKFFFFFLRNWIIDFIFIQWIKVK